MIDLHISDDHGDPSVLRDDTTIPRLRINSMADWKHVKHTVGHLMTAEELEHSERLWADDSVARRYTPHENGFLISEATI